MQNSEETTESKISDKPDHNDNNETSDIHITVTPSANEKHSGVLTAEEEEGPEHPACCSIDRPFPMLGFLKRYKSSYFNVDFVSGLTVGVIAIPQGMSNCLLANLPPAYGLYGCIVPVLVYVLFTTTRQVNVGPYAVVSVMIASFLSFIDYEQEEAEYIGSVLTIALFSGILLTLLGLLRCGFITRVLSDSVMKSFTASSAIVITTSQMGHYWGVKTGTGAPIKQLITLLTLASQHQLNWYAFLIGSVASVLLFAMKKVKEKRWPHTPIPLELFIVILGIVVMRVFGLRQRWNIKAVGDYPIAKGFPPLSLPSMTHWTRLIFPAAIIGIICYSSTIAVSKNNARAIGKPVDDNQELVALGMSHLVGSFFSSIAGSVSLSRSSVAATLDAKTPLFNIYSVVVILVCLFFLADWIALIPNAVLATVVIVNLFNSFASFKVLPTLWRCSPTDFWTFLACTVVMVLFGAEAGLIASIVVSLLLLWLSLHTLHPRAVEPLESVRAVEGVESVESQAEQKEKDVVVVAKEAIHFLNRDSLVQQAEKAIAMAEKGNKRITVDLRRTCFIDVSGMNALHDIFTLLKHHNIASSFVVEDDYLAEKLKAKQIVDIPFTKLHSRV